MITENLALLNNIAPDDVNEFYVITLWNNRLELQGNLTRETLEVAKKIGVPLNWNPNTNVLEGTGENIRMCLTTNI